MKIRVRPRKPGEFLSAMDRLLEGGLEDVFNAMKAAKEEGGNINETLPAKEDFEKRTLMHEVIEFLCREDQDATDAKVFEILDWMLANGANINAREHAGYNPLQVGIFQHKELKVIQYLCAKGANPNNQADKGWNSGLKESVLRAAMVAGSMDYVRCLCEYGARFRAEDITLITQSGFFRIDIGPELIRPFLLDLMFNSPKSFLALDEPSIEKLNQYFGNNVFQNVAKQFQERFAVTENKTDLKFSTVFLILSKCASSLPLYQSNLLALKRLHSDKNHNGFFGESLSGESASNAISFKVVNDLKAFYKDLMGESAAPYALTCIESILPTAPSKDKQKTLHH